MSNRHQPNKMRVLSRHCVLWMDDGPLMFCSPVYSDRTGRRQSLRNWISFQPTNQIESKSVYVYVRSIDSTKRADSALLQWSTTGRLTFDKNPCQFTTAWPRFLKKLRGNGPKRLGKYLEWKKSIWVTIWQLWDCIKDEKSQYDSVGVKLNSAWPSTPQNQSSLKCIIFEAGAVPLRLVVMGAIDHKQ